MKGITRQEFLDGVKFKLRESDSIHYRFSKSEESSDGCLVSWAGYEANVTLVGSKRASWFTFVLDKKVTGYLYFSELFRVEDE